MGESVLSKQKRKRFFAKYFVLSIQNIISGENDKNRERKNYRDERRERRRRRG